MVNDGSERFIAGGIVNFRFFGHEDGNLVSHFTGVGAVEDAVDFSFEEFVFEGVAFSGELEGEAFVLLGFFVVVFFGEVAGKVAVGNRKNRLKRGAVGTEFGGLEIGLIGTDKTGCVADVKLELDELSAEIDFGATEDLTDDEDENKDGEADETDEEKFGMQNIVELGIA